MSNADMAAALKRANSIWKLFVKVPPSQEAQCIKCHAILKRPTTTLVMHLQRLPDDFKAYEKERCAWQSSKCAMLTKPIVLQTLVADRFKPQLKSTMQKAQEMTKAIARFVVRGMHFYSVVEEPGFLAILNAAVPEYVVPSRTTL
ncbi:hypothetical protein HPB51_012902 [Rhipicephalus microplus]|uniref:BED-type domain-containing protein n=1 Tax=Rhipicephalus microplus TaxID=6941 RepID=A0A9J6EG76_RHIMP|nr:hypothetical protein HPB51_012902 [Rhipicephalus microplus]